VSVRIPARSLCAFLLTALCLLLLADSSIARNSRDEDSDQRAAARADEQYAQERFGAAYKTYLGLAKKGDPFSQYRVSFMSLYGQGTNPDVIEAFAWAVLAAESGDPGLLNYLNEVEALVPPDRAEAAQEIAEEYRHEWGKLALAIEARKKAKRDMRDCTGSRLGTRCEEVYAVQMPSVWSISPGVGNGSDGGSAAPSGSSSSAIHGSGGEKRDIQYYQELRQYTAALEQYIIEHGTNVELGEFDVIEPEDGSRTGDKEGSSTGSE